jgi:predicted nucleic acid binding AN1-type Zn finger protein
MARCHTCSRRLSLAEAYVGRCRCDRVLCSVHRMPEDHACPAVQEAATEKRSLLEKSLVRVVAPKVEMI